MKFKGVVEDLKINKKNLRNENSNNILRTFYQNHSYHLTALCSQTQL